MTKRIIICRPGNHYLGLPTDCWSNFQRYLHKHDNEFEYVERRKWYNGCCAMCRNLCLGGKSTGGKDQKPFQGRIDYDYILWIDSDSIYQPHQMKRLMKHDKDIVSGWYMSDAHQQSSVGVDWDLTHYQKYGRFKVMTKRELKASTGLIDAAWTGFGFLLMKQGVIESLGYPWFDYIKPEMGPGVHDMASEDVSISIKLINNGYDIWVDPAERVHHLKYTLY